MSEISESTAAGRSSTEHTQSPDEVDAMEEEEEEEEETEPVATLWCSGDLGRNNPQQHNFEGAWQLRTAAGGRPCYEHFAPDGTAVYLYFVAETAAGRCPRWVIGPEPAGSGANGWAYADSNAPRPEDIVETWFAWMETCEWGETRLAFSAKQARLGEDKPTAEGAAGGAPKKKKTKKKGGGKGGGKAGAKGGKTGGKPKAKAK